MRKSSDSQWRTEKTRSFGLLPFYQNTRGGGSDQNCLTSLRVGFGRSGGKRYGCGLLLIPDSEPTLSTKGTDGSTRRCERTKESCRSPSYRFRRASRQADKSNRGRRNTAAASPMASGVGPIKSQNRGWSALAAAIVPDNRRVRVKLKELMSDSFADRSVFRRSPRTLHWRVNSRDSHGRSVTLFC